MPEPIDRLTAEAEARRQSIQVGPIGRVLWLGEVHFDQMKSDRFLPGAGDFASALECRSQELDRVVIDLDRGRLIDDAEEGRGLIDRFPCRLRSRRGVHESEHQMVHVPKRLPTSVRWGTSQEGSFEWAANTEIVRDASIDQPNEPALLAPGVGVELFALTYARLKVRRVSIDCLIQSGASNSQHPEKFRRVRGDMGPGTAEDAATARETG